MDTKKECIGSYPDTLCNTSDCLVPVQSLPTYDTTIVDDCQSAPLQIGDKWHTKKEKSLHLCDIYRRLGYQSKADRVLSCGNFLDFKAFVHDDGTVSDIKLHRANFCKDNLCPMCAWRRSLKIFGQTSAIMDVIGSDHRFVFATFTVPNVSGSVLKLTIDRMMLAFKRLSQRALVKKHTDGFFRALEITYNSKTNTFHPHFHVVFAVDPSYAQQSSIHYIKQSDWLKMWQECFEDDTIQFVNVKMCRPDIDGTYNKSVCEISKYAVKPSDYNDYVVSIFTDSLYNRRLFHYGGIFKKVASDLKLDDIQDGDLTHVEAISNPTLANIVLKHKWQIGVGYVLYDIVPYLPI